MKVTRSEPIIILKTGDWIIIEEIASEKPYLGTSVSNGKRRTLKQELTPTPKKLLSKYLSVVDNETSEMSFLHIVSGLTMF